MEESTKKPEFVKLSTDELEKKAEEILWQHQGIDVCEVIMELMRNGIDVSTRDYRELKSYIAWSTNIKRNKINENYLFREIMVPMKVMSFKKMTSCHDCCMLHDRSEYDSQMMYPGNDEHICLLDRTITIDKVEVGYIHPLCPFNRAIGMMRQNRNNDE